MTSAETKMFLCTANVGTVFEQLDTMMKPYVSELTKKIDHLKPEFVAIHLQELGGKHYKHAMQSVNTFFKYFLSNEVVREYERYLIVMDSDFTNDTTFTSLCNIYLIHNSLTDTDVEIYNFREKSFYKYLTRQIYTGNLHGNDFIYKERFEKKFFPEFNWSRKGFLQTKWRIRNKTINLVNIHLFHDASNLVALSQSPSIYSENRKKALKYTTEKMNGNQYLTEIDSFTALFGDFNFRLDLGPLIDKYTSKPKNNGVKESDEACTKHFKDTDDRDIFVIADKKFKWSHSSSIQDETKHLEKFDKEISALNEPLFEFTRTFPPSYPFMEDLTNFEKYMETRCPAWCDRVIFNEHLNKQLLVNQASTEYDMVGLKASMGDHKPIYLFFTYNSESTPTDSVEINPCDSNNNTILDRQNTHNFAFINFNLANLNNSINDMHDNAWFSNTHPLNYLKHDPHAYASYTLNLNPTGTGSNEKSIEFQPQDTPAIYEQKQIVLNQWLRSIAELIIQLHRSTTSSTVCYKMNPNDTDGCTEDKACRCVLQLENLTRSYMVQFFINSLNGNFFKLKHLMTYLNEQIVILSNLLGTIVVSSSSSNELKFNIHDLRNPLDISHKSLNILTEIHVLLNSKCIVNLFRRELQKTISDRRLSIYFNFYSNRNFHVNAAASDAIQ